MRKTFQFIGPSPSGETIEALEELLQRARDGDLIGLSYTAILRGKNWTYGTTGEATRSPAFVIGLLHVQTTELAHRITGGFESG